MIKTIVIGADHGGVEMKSELIKRLTDEGYNVLNAGTDTTASVDYPDIAVKAARMVTAGAADCGILICGTGIGIGIAANKVRGIRAAHCADCYSARMSREHNNANIITLGARTLGIELAWEIIKAYLGASFQGGKHQIRVDKLDSLTD
ncbi:MAG: ribose 5-phosphate isomerase B [Angelakisella sp.]